MLNMDHMDQEYQVGDPTDAIKDLSAEITALKELRESGAKNVNIMLDAFVLDNEMWIVAEFCTGGSVHALVSKSGSSRDLLLRFQFNDKLAFLLSFFRS
jgi:serine/threonine protein kinase